MNRFHFHLSCSHEFGHYGHVKRPKNKSKLGLRNMDDETLTAVSEILVKNCPTVLSNQFLLFLTRERLTTGSINSLMNCVLVKKRRSNPDETTAKTLTRLLKPNDDIEHVSCTSSYNEELDLVKVCRQCKNVKNVTEQDVDSVSGNTKSLAKFVINGL